MINKRRWVAIWLSPGLFLLFFPDVVTAKKDKNIVVLTRIMDMADRWFRKARVGWVEHARFSQGVSRKPNIFPIFCWVSFLNPTYKIAIPPLS